MVVTRRAPVPLPVVVSRTPSSQPIPRVAKGKATASAHEQPHPVVNGKSRADPEQELPQIAVDASPEPGIPKRGEQKAKWRIKRSKTSKKRRSRTLFDLLTNVIIGWIIAYALIVCPNNQRAPHSTVCYGLSEYRRLILDPYVFPPINHLLAHPSVAPYIAILQPPISRVVAISRPVAARAKSEFNGRIVPQWDNYIVPCYNTYIGPQIHTVKRQLQPYLGFVETVYDRYLGTYIHSTALTFGKWQKHAQPYVIIAANKSYNAYQTIKICVQPFWRRFELTILRLIQFADQYRRQFVDPHVAQMWMKAKELSSRRKFVAPSPIEHSTTHTHPNLAQEPETATEVFANEFASTVTSFQFSETQEQLSVSVYDAATSTPSAIVVTPEVLNPLQKGTQEPVEIEVGTPSIIVPVDTGTAESVESPTTSDLPLPTISPAEIPSSISPSSEPSASSIALPGSSDQDEIDMAAFYDELGLNEPEAGKEGDSEHQVLFFAPPEESEEDRAARLTAHREEVAIKRQEITLRHGKWERDLNDLINETKKALKKSLIALRKAAALDMKEHVDIRTAIEGLVGDAEKYLKGAEGYLKNLSNEDRKEEEKKTLWARVVDKVDEKFAERLRETEMVVNRWYGLVEGAELEEVAKATAAVRDLAERAQADVGLDYAWLDDVTVQDWQHYHDIMRQSENFTREATMIQNGTHAFSPINPVIPAIEDLQAEVEDVIVGFETRLRRIKRNGDRVFGSTDDDRVLVDDETVDEPQVSILPIVPEEEHFEADIPPVIIGKSQEQILEALGNAGVKVDLPTSSPPSREEVEDIIKEAEAESKSTPSSVVNAPLHMEL